jgi:methionine sulfoxide reductase heme-binding subunit
MAWLVKHHFGLLRWASFVVCLGPALWLGAEWQTGTLGINPLNRLLHFSGRWALIMLLVTLAVTPLRRLSVRVSQLVHARYGKRLSDWNWLIRLRRQFGLFAFFYAGLHLAVYLAFDAGLDGQAIRDDALERPFILLGLAAFVLLLPLAATSNRAAIRFLGRAWRRLHLLTYPIAVLAAIHFWLQMKVGQSAPLGYSIVLALLLAVRAIAWRSGDRAASVEAPARAEVLAAQPPP